MDYFYAAIEQRDDPSIQGRPVVICMYSGRTEMSGAVSTCNYLARERGIRAGMPCTQAKKIDNEAVFLPVRKEYYTMVSDNIMNILRPFADSAQHFEQISVDEAFLDITRSFNGDFDKALETGIKIKQRIKSEENLTCSIGIGPNKLIAKMASSYKKPDGITVITPEKSMAFLEPLDVKKLWGIGKVTESRLAQIGVRTIGQLAEYDQIRLIEIFGKKKGVWLKRAAMGLDDSMVQERGDSNQISRIATLPENTRDFTEITFLLDRLADDVISRVTEAGVSFKQIVFIGITSDLKMHTRSKILNHAITDQEILRRNIGQMAKDFLEDTSLELRRVGVRVDDLQNTAGQLTLKDYI